MLSLIGGLYLYMSNYVVKRGVEPFPDSIWEMALDDVHENWTMGVDLKDEYFLRNCPGLSSSETIPRELRSCRASLLSCFYAGKNIKFSYKKNWYVMGLKFVNGGELGYSLSSPSDEAVTKASRFSLGIDIILSSNKNKETKRFYLNDICRQVDLPQGFYRYGGARSKKTKNLWHPSQVTYSIDKYLVRNIDIQEWLGQINKEFKEEAVTFEEERPYAPATSLTISQMRRYCGFKGGEVLSSQVLDTLTYHHGRVSIDEIKDRPPGANTSPYPFGPRLVDSPHYFALKKNSPATNETCQKIFSAECLKLTPQTYTWGQGWSGVYELLGGPLEYVHNKEMPRRNLKLSSFYFPLNSKVHQAGIRGFWSGEDFTNAKSFNFFRYSPQKVKEPYKVGFRCMKVSGA